MRIGILVSSIGAFGQKGFYNAQEVGLAKALGKLCEEVVVYRLVDANQEEHKETVEGCDNTRVWFIPAKRIGNNGLLDLSLLDKTLDALVFFSDMQLIVPQVHRWAKRNAVKMIPYIGVIESHSGSVLKRVIMNALFRRNLAAYHNCHCLAKTPAVKEKLRKMGVEQVTVAPVGLDLSLMKQEAQNADPLELKEKFGYGAEDQVLLFIGRLIEEKQPVKMVDIFARISRTDTRYKLLMVGTGPLEKDVEAAVAGYGLENQVRMIDRIPNADIWQLYRMADCFVNLNQQEIFGMAILEAMYYGCKVAAWKAPGPSFIIEDGRSGYLADSDEGIIAAICHEEKDPQEATKRILEHFTWKSSAELILSILCNN